MFTLFEDKNIWGFVEFFEIPLSMQPWETFGNLLYIKWKCYKTIVGAITWVSFIFYAKCLTSVKRKQGGKKFFSF